MSKLVKYVIPATVLFTLMVSGCSSIPFVGDDDNDDPRRARDEKIETAFIYIPKGELQCQDDTGDDLKTTKTRLESDGISVYSSDCGVITGRMETALCGSLTLDINIHEINENDIEAAGLLGFAPVKSLKEQDVGYETMSCDR